MVDTPSKGRVRLGDAPAGTGIEIEYPMAIVILGGLVVATLLNLFIVPSLYLQFGKRNRDRIAPLPQPAA